MAYIQGEDGRAVALSGLGETVELLLKLLKFANLINRPLQDQVAVPQDVSLNGVCVMLGLGALGEAASHELADLMAIHPMNVSRATAELRREGQVEERCDPANRRRKPLQLTSTGWRSYERLIPQIRTVAEQLFARVTQEEQKLLACLIDKINGEMQGAAQTAA